MGAVERSERCHDMLSRFFNPCLGPKLSCFDHLSGRQGSQASHMSTNAPERPRTQDQTQPFAYVVGGVAACVGAVERSKRCHDMLSRF